MTHDFDASLEWSKQQSCKPWWQQVYRQAFPDFSHMEIVDDLPSQLLGIDRYVFTKSGKRLTVDEKVRTRVWSDFALEYWSREPSAPGAVDGALGWVAKDHHTDFLAYAFEPSQECYVLPFQTLRAAWKKYGKQWVDTYQPVRAHNATYTTVSVAVPIDVLLKALGDVVLCRWNAPAQPYDDFDAPKVAGVPCL